MDRKIVLIDGNSIINRAFFGVPPLTNEEGLHTNAIYGFLNIMFRIVEAEQPDHLAVAFDVHAPTFRHEIYKDYKGTRKGMPDELKEQVPVLKELLKAMDIKMLEKAGLEADDILGTLARRAEKEGMSVTVVSGDRDLLQIATDHVKVCIPKTRGGKTDLYDYHTQDVINEYGIPPLGIIELKALMGDASDNIPGVPRVGEKTATELVIRYGDIETVREHIDEISKKSVRESLRENFDMARLSKVLATIDTDADIEFDLESCKIKDFYTGEAYPIVKRLGFKKFLERFSAENAADNSRNTKETLIITALEDADMFFKDLPGDYKEIGLSLDLGSMEKSVSLYLNDKIYVIRAEGLITADYLAGEIAALVKRAGDVTFVTADLKDSLRYLPDLVHPDITGEKFFDVIIAAYLINPLIGSYEAGDLLTRYKELKEKLIEGRMYDLFKNIEMPLTACLCIMETEGIGVIPDELMRYGMQLDEQIRQLEKRIHEAAGNDFNINSPRQLGEILFEKMQIPGGKKTKTGYSTAADVLEKLAPDHPFVADILEYRGLAKLKSTYVDALFQLIGPDGRIHSTFHQTITATGRLSSSDPNLQNIPIRTEQGRLIRKVFVPKDGCIFLDADYSQIELRIMAHMSGDEKLINAYRRADDIHAITASEVFNVPLDDVTKEMRRNAKAVNFGIIYGISSFGLSQGLSISRKEAKEYIDRYFEKFPQIKQYLDRLIQDAKQKGYAETMFGRRRPIPELNSSNFMQRSFGERVAMNAPIQGTAADIIKIAMINVVRRLQNEGLKSKLILQVHDELLIETYIPEKEQVEKILSEEMTKACDLSVDLEIDMHEGSNWYEAK